MNKSNVKNVIRFQAQISQVRTLADGGIRLILDLSETAIETATKMMEVRQAGAILEIAAIPVKKIKSNSSSKTDEFNFELSI